MSLATYDLFTDEEAAIYGQIISQMNNIEKQSNSQEREHQDVKDAITNLLTEKKNTQNAQATLIAKHKGTPRRVRLTSVLDTKKFFDQDDRLILPSGVSWWALRPSRRIAEFASEASRAMGLKQNEVTFDKIIVKWKSLDVMEQIVLDGFIMPIVTDTGEVIEKKYRFLTASAGQLRTDKLQFISEDMWPRIQRRLECGMDWNAINEKGGMNVNKLMAYTALSCSATDEWADMDIDRCIVIKDFEAPVTGMMKYIKPDYSSEIGIQTVQINHCDGIGMMLPSVSRSNFMVRLPYIKGQLTSFDYLKFCETNNVEPKITDRWGTEHDLIQEDIRIIFTESQFKQAKFYDNWDQYKQFFKDCKCTINRTNFEENYIPDTTINYQMLQTLEDFTDEEIEIFTAKTHERIENIAKDQETMLYVLHAEAGSTDPYCQALQIYPALLRDAYARESLKAIKKRWQYDAKSGRIKCQNKRLFAIPDMYAACEHWFLGIKEPQGQLADGEIACNVYRDQEKADVLRSPHLFMEHAVRSISHDPRIYEWFYTNGVYTSCHDLISRIQQFDVDGDQQNVVVEPVIVAAAERNIEKYQVIPLFYDANKAGAEQVCLHSMYKGLKRAHDFSGIGMVSNSLTKLWNRDVPDREAAAWLCYYNNLVIDAAKTGIINSYEAYPKVNSRINKATGGKRGKMPYFFQFSKNGRKQTLSKEERKKKYAKPNKSVMNRICARFDDIGNINMNYAGIEAFNWQMMMPGPIESNRADIVELFCALDSDNLSNLIELHNEKDFMQEIALSYEVLKDTIVHELLEICGSLEEAYPHIVKHLFTGENAAKASHKQMFWRVFGEIAVRTLTKNLAEHISCLNCGQKIPTWNKEHLCPKTDRGLVMCVDCGIVVNRLNSKQYRCECCQAEYRKITERDRQSKFRRRQSR